MSGAELIDGRIVLNKPRGRVLMDNKPVTITMDRPKRFRVETDVEQAGFTDALVKTRLGFDLIVRRLEYNTKWN